MATPLVHANDSALNSTDSSANQNEFDGRVESYTATDSDGPPSSPFVANVSDPSNYENEENISPSKQLSRLTSKSPIEREPTSPLKMLKSRDSPTKAQSPQKISESIRSPRKLSSPEKRFPIKVSPSPEKRPVLDERTLTIEDVLRDNEGLTKAIQILEDEDSVLIHAENRSDEVSESNHEDHVSDDTLTSLRGAEDDGHNMDDTMFSTFSTFSAVPDMTMFAKIGHSPTKYSSIGATPRRTQMNTPATARRPMNRTSSPTPRGPKYGASRDDGNTTNLILDFTDQISGFSGRLSPVKLTGLSPSKGTDRLNYSKMPDMSCYGPTSPTVSRMSNLLDFDIPPAPTPRSMPSITPRELETLKSSFLSEISSLKASLSGKEAEVQSLKTAVGDAEKRVGESMEQVREERNFKEQLAAEKEEWEKRGREMEAVLRNVKEEIVHGERDREDLEGRLEECERRREAAEMMAQEAESKMAAVKGGKVTQTLEASEKSGECDCGGRAIELAVEKVSRELHTLYKEKHETKVSALKKSYERRWEKKVKDLESQIEDLSKENEELKRDLTITKVEPKNPLEVNEDLEKQAARDAKTKELEASLEGVTQEVKSVKHDNSELRKLLDAERVEKGKLVQAVDEMIPLVAAFDEMLANMDSSSQVVANISPQKSNQHTAVENLRGSISRASGLRAPTSISSITPGESRIGRGGFGAPVASSSHERGRSGSTQGMPRPGSGLSHRSGIMSSIEKMGSYKGRGAE